MRSFKPFIRAVPTLPRPHLDSVGDKFRGSVRFRHIVERVHQAGPRAIAELILEVAEAGADPASIGILLERWSRIDPETVRRVDGDRWPRAIRSVPPPKEEDQ